MPSLMLSWISYSTQRRFEVWAPMRTAVTDVPARPVLISCLIALSPFLFVASQSDASFHPAAALASTAPALRTFVARHTSRA